MKHTDLIKKLNLEQKCALLSGETVFTTRDFSEKGIPAITLSDGPNAVPLERMRDLLSELVEIDRLVKARPYLEEDFV